MILEKVAVGPLMVNCFVIGCEKTRKGIVIDPGEDAELIFSAIEKHSLSIDKILLTHGHVDHITAVAEVANRTGAGVYLHQKDVELVAEGQMQAQLLGLRVPDNFVISGTLSDGDKVTCGNLELAVLATPGHTPGSVSFHVQDHLFAGDTLFASSIGRTDLPGGSFQQIIRSITEKIYSLPDNTTVHPGHGPTTTVGFEKSNNPFTRP